MDERCYRAVEGHRLGAHIAIDPCIEKSASRVTGLQSRRRCDCIDSRVLPPQSSKQDEKGWYQSSRVRNRKVRSEEAWSECWKCMECGHDELRYVD